MNRQDLKGFDKESTELLLWAQGQGARIRVTKGGHAFVYAPDKTSSTTVPPNLKKGNRSAQNARAQIAKMFGKKAPR